MSWTARADEAEAAAVILAGGRALDGPVTLTAGAALACGDIAGIVSGLTGRDIRHEVLGDEEWVARQAAGGTPEAAARFLPGFFQAAREGLFATVDPLLGELLGRPPRTVRDLLASRAA